MFSAGFFRDVWLHMELLYLSGFVFCATTGAFLFASPQQRHAYKTHFALIVGPLLMLALETWAQSQYLRQQLRGLPWVAPASFSFVYFCLVVSDGLTEKERAPSPHLKAALPISIFLTILLTGIFHLYVYNEFPAFNDLDEVTVTKVFPAAVLFFAAASCFALPYTRSSVPGTPPQLSFPLSSMSTAMTSNNSNDRERDLSRSQTPPHERGAPSERWAEIIRPSHEPEPPASPLSAPAPSIPLDSALRASERQAFEPQSEQRLPTLHRRDEPEPEATPAIPVPAIPQSKPPRGMYLKLRRAQRTTAITGKVVFTLDARIDLLPDERILVNKYRLGDMIVYESVARKEHSKAVDQHIADSKPASYFSAKEAARSWYKMGRAGMSAALAALSLRITIDSLTQGVHIECKSLSEMIAAENAIVEAGESVKAYLDLAATFDGREDIIEL